MMQRNWSVILNYNLASYCLARVNALHSVENTGIFIVDNSSSEKDYLQLREACVAFDAVIADHEDVEENTLLAATGIEGGAKLILYRSKKNLGYAGGNNIALKLLHRVVGGGGQYLLINPDVVIEPAAASALLACDAEICGPAVFEHYMKSVRPLNRVDFATGFSLEADERGGKTSGPVLSGCCLKVSGTALSKYGFLPDENFLYEEEIKYFERVYRLGGQGVYLLNVRVEHIGSVSVIKRSRRYYYYILRNRLTYFIEIAGPQYKQYWRFIRLYVIWYTELLYSNLKRRNWDGLKGILLGGWHGLRRIKGPYES
jgi:GT2 family glycosyltransferase